MSTMDYEGEMYFMGLKVKGDTGITNLHKGNGISALILAHLQAIYPTMPNSFYPFWHSSFSLHLSAINNVRSCCLSSIHHWHTSVHYKTKASRPVQTQQTYILHINTLTAQQLKNTFIIS